MRNPISPTKNPARLGGLIMGLVSAVLVLLVAFGVDLSGSQQQAIVGVVGALIALAAALGVGELIERRVTSRQAPTMPDGEPAMIARVTGTFIDGGE